MNINATLLGQMITFMLFILFTKKYVWPPLTQALRERQEKIADGLAAAERGHHDLALAKERAAQNLRTSKEEAAKIIEEAKKYASQIVENAKQEASVEGDKVKLRAQSDIDQMVANAQEGLRLSAAKMAIFGAGKVLSQKIDEAANQDLLDSLVREL